jgi:hypothetical protein
VNEIKSFLVLQLSSLLADVSRYRARAQLCPFQAEAPCAAAGTDLRLILSV